ncbi:DUF202 domain-containing protein [Goodfellowiella coeruleoviolacea]|uniref:DUF202 domain-containing protein n=1 Tax=Goodfellowiella coeruleoviolacea TaxID=334858 RepID=A0AAE3KEH1_9PSEU|nr:DUF202 domain-containing protein [Goodfellowiella coeruleoviolacea]MCP2163897.1 protein of unknown function (DUF202) [Goodfellowiella coeruleoviolacea]
MAADRDPGLQPERTALAWQRTAFTATVLAVLLVRAGVLHAAPLEIAAGVLASVLVLVCLTAVRAPAAAGSSRRRLAVAAFAAAGTGLLTTAQLLVTG